MRRFWTRVAIVVLSCLFCRVPAWVAAQGLGSTSQTKENLDLPYDAIGEGSEEEIAPSVIVFYGQSFEGDGVFYVIDRSGSMQGAGELDIAKREVVRNIKEFSSNMQFAVVFFDSNVLKYPSGGQPTDASTTNKQSAIGWVTGMAGGSGSAISLGLFAGIDFSNRSTSDRKTIIYVGDGGGYSAALLGQVKGKNTAKAKINCIGVLSLSTDRRQFLQSLAQSNNGKYTEITR
jgi:hypothetical protein